jgi:dTDP-glucose 4,6-dehydratase
MNILITGGMGFIGANLVKHMVETYPNYRIINFDKITYASNPSYVKDLNKYSNYHQIVGDICDESALMKVFSTYKITHVIHLAAESHVDNSIMNPSSFIQTNIVGTANLLNVCKMYWKDGEHKFYHISTDEVYGSLGDEGYFTETTPYDPRSPYSASKAASDHLVRAYYHTYGLPVVISNCSNNYGPNQHKEKLIPLTIDRIRNNEPIPVYGNGMNVRDWLYVGDHITAIDTIFHKGKIGETYNVGGNNESTNIELVTRLCDLMDEKLGLDIGESRKLITYVTDRLGHDKRYAIDSTKLTKELGWSPKVNFTDGLNKTIEWYLQTY